MWSFLSSARFANFSAVFVCYLTLVMCDALATILQRLDAVRCKIYLPLIIRPELVVIEMVRWAKGIFDLQAGGKNVPAKEARERLQMLDGISDVEANYAAQAMSVEFDPDKVTHGKIRKAIRGRRESPRRASRNDSKEAWNGTDRKRRRKSSGIRSAR